MFHSTRFRLLAGFLIVPFIAGWIFLFIGGYLLEFQTKLEQAVDMIADVA